MSSRPLTASKRTTPRRTPRRGVAVLTALATTGCLTLATACGSGGAGGGDGVIDYWLWDSAQQPGYQRCADAFTKANPDVKVRITQYGWDDYWNKVTAGFVADTAPDVFTNHLAKYAQYVDLGVLRSLDDLAATKGLRDDDYQEGLAALWKGQDGKRYGAPKDWDTIAIFYDRALTKAAGITDQQLATMTWNPKDGGTFERIVAHLTVDANGKRGDEPGFDKTKVEVYGVGGSGSGGDNYGQAQWSAFTGSNNWTATDKNPWGTKFNFDQPKFQETIAWYYGLAKKGYMPGYRETTKGNNTVGGITFMSANQAAMATEGSWMIASFVALTDANGKPRDIAVAPTPIGPSGKRASMFNGLADSITTNSKEPEQAAKWVAFMASETCQDIIGQSGVVFPARPKATELAIAYNKSKRGLDVTPFTDQVKQQTTFLMPVVNMAADIRAIMRPTMDAVLIGSQPVSSLTDMNTQVNEVLSHQ